MVAPFVWAGLWLSLGFLIGWQWSPEPHRVWLALLLLLGLGLVTERFTRWFLASSAAILVLCGIALTHDPIQPWELAARLPAEPTEITVLGTVASDPDPAETQYGQQLARWVLRVEAVALRSRPSLRSGLPFGRSGLPSVARLPGDPTGGQARLPESSPGGQARDGTWEPVAGRLLVRAMDPERLPRYGDELILLGRWSRVRGPGNPGQFDYRRFLAIQRIDGMLDVQPFETMQWTGRNRAWRPIQATFEVKRWILRLFEQFLPDRPSRELLEAMILGNRAGLSDDLQEALIKTGTVHLLSISGLHVAILAGVVWYLLLVLRVPRVVASPLVTCLVILYAVMVGGRPPVVRAVVMAAILMFGQLIRRPAQALNSLGLAAFALLVWNPLNLLDLGFQLSFLSVLGIVLLSPAIREWLEARWTPARPRWLHRLVRGAWLAVAVSLGAWLATLPLVAWRFNVVSLVAIVANLLLVPLVTAMMATLAVSLVIAPLALWASEIALAALWMYVHVLLQLAQGLAALPLAALRVPTPPAWWVGLGYAWLGFWIAARRFHWRAAPVVMAGLLVVNLAVWPRVWRRPPARLEVTCLDVGHGDAIVVRSPNGATWLIDAGRSAPRNAGRAIVLPFLWQAGIEVLDAVFVTHPDADHVGGLPAVLQEMRVRHVFTNGDRATLPTFIQFERVVRKRGLAPVALRQGDRIEGVEPLLVDVVHPPRDWTALPSSNDRSLVLRLRYRDMVILLTGDVVGAGLAHLVASGQALQADIVKLPHHGGRMGEAGEAFLTQVNPRAAVISTDVPSRFHHPAPETEALLSRWQVSTTITGRDGAVTVETDGEEWRLVSFREHDR